MNDILERQPRGEAPSGGGWGQGSERQGDSAWETWKRKEGGSGYTRAPGAPC